MEKDYSRLRYIIGTNISNVRKAQKLKQSDLVKIAGIPQTSLSQWEIGTREISLQNLFVLSDALHVPVTAFLPVEETEDPKLSAAIRKLEKLPPKKRKILYDLIDAMQE